MRSNSKTSLEFLLTVCLVAASLLWWQWPDELELKGVVYILDEGADVGSPAVDAAAAAEIGKSLTALHCVSTEFRPVASLRVFNDHQALWLELDRSRAADPPSPVFFMLSQARADSMKRLRAYVEGQDGVKGRDRARLLSRLVVVRSSAGLGSGDGCAQLDDNIIYAKWTFAGIGLLVDGAGASALRQCLAAQIKRRDKSARTCRESD